MDKELRFVREGGHTVGAGVVTEIVLGLNFMAGNSKRTIVQLESSVSTGYRYGYKK